MASKGKKLAGVEIPECPVCFEMMSVPVFLCQSGHSLCKSCTEALCPPHCPICREPMTQMRNRSLEEIIDKAKIPCPNRDAGCIFTVPGAGLAKHLEECRFRRRDCPHVIFGECSWTGDLKSLLEHFKEKHSAHCITDVDSLAGWRVEMIGIDLRNSMRVVYVASQQSFIFIITFKIDTHQRMAYWAIQLIGHKKIAHQHVYEIHVLSRVDQQRKVIFTEHCVDDIVTADDIFRHGTCAVMPLGMLVHFVKDRTLSFRFIIKRITRDSSETRQTGLKPWKKFGQKKNIKPQS